MISKSGLAIALLLAAAPAVAQAQESAPSGPQAAIQQAAMAFGQCVSTGVQAVAATVTPEAGAADVLNGCTTQRDQLEQAVEALIATLPEEHMTAAREQFRSQMGQAESQIAGAIRQQRATAAAAPSE